MAEVLFQLFLFIFWIMYVEKKIIDYIVVSILYFGYNMYLWFLKCFLGD